MQRLVLVGGAPRSGTTVLHGLLCTAETVNDFREEPSYLGFMFRAWSHGLTKWQNHTFDFHDNRKQFADRMRGYLVAELDHIWRRAGRPAVLALKDPTITTILPRICDLMPEALAVLSIRHPHAVVRSRQEVMERQTGRPFTAADAAKVAEEYAHGYEVQRPEALIVRYEDLPEIPAVADALGVEIRPERLWCPRGPSVLPDSPWFSPKYRDGLDVSGRLSDLAPELRDIVDRRCGALMARFGYSA